MPDSLTHIPAANGTARGRCVRFRNPDDWPNYRHRVVRHPHSLTNEIPEKTELLKGLSHSMDSPLFRFNEPPKFWGSKAVRAAHRGSTSTSTNVLVLVLH
jgi:hypothetical protein